MEKIVKLCSVYTEDVEELKNMFVDSIKDDWELNIKKIEENENDFRFHSNQFVKTMIEKLNFVLENINENMGNIIIISDVDILFYRKCNDIILELIKDKDILFQADHSYDDDINGGFIIIRCNEKTKKLYEDASKMNLSELFLIDQTALQIGLKTNDYDLKWGLLPYDFYVDTQLSLPPKNLIIHHANGTWTTSTLNVLTRKINRLNDVKNYITLNCNEDEYVWNAI